ncbi:hypothetical protein MSG28_009865 [Choristoneura fumiferana]|uniref:Uncharacterized protein n=1 Tax=Choristoneura fumiferana TaxID=7141 RepID=A0ACC0JCS9_CHOFU|nr:hypothetical protein MSG28_009865 [Choristoneura fumiferana]
MKPVVLVCLALACAASAQSEARESRTVQTAQGPVRGYKTDEIFEFYGIPYATAPTGKDRFKAPLPGPVWMNILEAVNDKIVCPQGGMQEMSLFASGLFMQENCLIANVLMPDTEETNLPVYVVVHGGAYQMGFGNMIQPKSLVKTKKIVAVTFNYRLGLHGFLCLGTEGAPGNAGMKDQVALLRWVKENIANFGGNPNDVTIGGYSAGSSAVDLLMLSESTKGLYNKVIPESGANVGVWSIQIDPLQNAKEFARNNNFTAVDDINALEEFYKTASFDLLTSDVFMDRKDTTFLASPCVERNIGEETFLEDNPVNLLKQGKYRKVPILSGFANMEGLFRTDKFVAWKDQMNEQFADFLPGDLTFRSDDKPVGEETVQAYIDYFTDVIFAYPHLRSIQLQVAAGSDSIYLYEYSFYSPPLEIEGMPPVPEFIKKIRGANHCAQKPVPEGSALPAWPPVGANRSPYMDFGEELQLKGPLLESRALFWDGIYEQYYKSPVPPSPYQARDEL